MNNDKLKINMDIFLANTKLTILSKAIHILNQFKYSNIEDYNKDLITSLREMECFIFYHLYEAEEDSSEDTTVH